MTGRDELKITWNDAQEASATLRDGEVLVFMRRSAHHEANMAHAVMAYVPKAVLPRARRYLDKPTMRAADLTLTKALLAGAHAVPGARNPLFPGEPPRGCTLDTQELDTQEFARWLYRLASREPGDDSTPLAYNSRHLHVAVKLVANRRKLEERGVEPYRKDVKKLIYDGAYDSVYLLGRDKNIWAVREIFDRLCTDGRVSGSERFATSIGCAQIHGTQARARQGGNRPLASAVARWRRQRR